MVNKVIELLQTARKSGVQISVNKGELQVKLAKNTVVQPGLLQQLKENKEQIISFLNEEKWKARKVASGEINIRPFDRAAVMHVPLSFSQERLWFVDRLEGSVQYHLPTVLRLKGRLNIDALQFAVKNIIERHEALRTIFYEHDGQVYQQVKDVQAWQMQLADTLQNGPDLQTYIESCVKAPFDLAKDYMLRAVLIPEAEDDHLLVVTMHHIASDAWSMAVIVKEVAEAYASVLENRQAQLAPLQLQYADYAVWQRSQLKGDVLEGKINYWKEKLTDLAPLELPADYSRPPLWSNEGTTVGFSLDKSLSLQLQELGRGEGATLFMVMLAAFKVLMFKYSGQEDICVGTSIAGREHPELENLVGFFVNMLPLRTTVGNGLSFAQLLQEVKSTTTQAFQHQEVPFEKIVDIAGQERDLSRNALFQVLFVLENTPDAPALQLGELVLSGENIAHATTKFDITFFVSATANGLQCAVQYSTNLYRADTIERMISHYKRLLNTILKQKETKIKDLTLLSAAEEHQLLTEFNSRVSDYPKDKSIAAVFESQVLKTPDKAALVFEQEEFTYRLLNERANQLAHYLHKKGIRKESLVAVCMERSTDLIISILGILKAGGAYVPVDPEYPEERIRFMLEDTGASIVLSTRESRSKLSFVYDSEIVEVDTEWPLIGEEPVEDLSLQINGGHLAYVIYTSGSTGRPKGVMVEHDNVVSLVKGVDYVSLDDRDVLLSTGSPSFDASTFEYWAMLLNGGQLTLCNDKTLFDIDLLKQEMEDRRVNMMWFTSSWLNQLVESDITVFKNLKTVLAGGEKLSEFHIERLRRTYPGIALVNGYGPTENTTFSLTCSIHEVNGSIPIGRPLSNREAYILDEFGQLVPTGVAGEIHLGGAGLSRGYLNRDELTEQRFIYASFETDRVKRIYKTGDTGKWCADGTIEYLGRKDEQVKIRGYRIELGEIESVLQQSSLVSQAAVVVKEDKQGNKRLCAYIVPGEDYSREEIIIYLQEKLPEYMVPSFYTELENLPLTKNGKTDRKALPDPEVNDLKSNEYIAPRNETELKLAAIWEDILEIDKVGVRDNFFKLGGHSLLAIRVISTIRKQLETEVSINSVFENPTIEELAMHVQTQSMDAASPVNEFVSERPKHIPLSFSQERLWFIDRLEGSLQYHVPTVLRLNGELNRNALEFALKTVVERHEVLRTVFLEEEDGNPYQYIRDAEEWEITVTDEPIYLQDRNALESFIRSITGKPFDLAKDYLMRANLIVLGKEDYVLVITFHHIASDGWSRSVLVNEVVVLYNSYEQGQIQQLPPLTTQYSDYSIWQRNYLQGSILESKLQYWKENLWDTNPLQLPTDTLNTQNINHQGALLDFEIDKTLSNEVQKLSESRGVTLFMTLMAAFKVLLYRYSGQEDICVGTAVAGRHRQELEGLIGFFLNTLALRDQVDGEETFDELLQKVKATTLKAYENQEIPFERVVETVVKERDAIRSPLFKVMLILQNTPDIPDLRFGKVKLSREEVYTHSTSMFDFTFYITETSKGLHASVEYSTALYCKETIARLIGHYTELLQSIVESPSKKISFLPMLTKAEEHKLLVEFNNTEVAYARDKTIVDLFREQVVKIPDAIAVVNGEEKITYEELNKRSDELAHLLAGKGVTHGVFVAICIERSIELVVGILGILKAGGAYVPIDEEYPEERIAFIIRDTGVELVVSTSKHLDLLAERDVEIVLVNNEGFGNSFPFIKKEGSLLFNSVVCVIYTSGSSGQPKGVLLNNKGIVNRLYWMWNTYPFSSGEKSALKTSVGFVDHLWELFGPLNGGIASVVFSKEEVRDVEVFVKKLALEKITRLVLVPSLLRAVLEYLKEENRLLENLCYWSSSGEQLSNELISNFYETFTGQDFRLLNIYGSTEVTADVIYYDTAGWKDKKNSKTDNLIGKPIWNCEIYITDKVGNLVPPGVFGELNVGGVQLADGYLNSPKLTLEKFVENVFKKDTKLYRTGDIARWMADGNIEYFGRKDRQVKIRGNRVELQEIENALRRNEFVKEAVVLVKEDKNGNQRLLSYYTPEWNVFKERERKLYFSQLSTWKQLYEAEYSNTVEEDQDEEFNIDIWNDSFTGKPIEKDRMKGWLEDIVEVILAEKPQNVLEIGCGVGLIYYRLAGKIKKYIGTDFSITSINKIKEHISKSGRDFGPTEFITVAAHEVELKEEEVIDTIILNSIVQYFPGEGYMDDVIERCMFLLKKGRIIIGDIRNNDLLEFFKGRLQLQKLRESLSIKDFAWLVEQDVLKEEELCVSPDYFHSLRSKYPQITYIEVKWKKGFYVDELSSYRYTVIIYINEQKEIFEPTWQEWDEVVDRNSITTQLELGKKVIALKNVPNPRLWQEKLLSKALDNKLVNTVGDLLQVIGKEDNEILQVRKIIELAEHKGYKYRMILDNDPFKVNLLIESSVTNNFIEGAYTKKSLKVHNNQLLSNIPLLSDISFSIQNEIKTTLQRRLPEYMVPSQFVVIRDFPLNNNGKIDRKFLKEKEDVKSFDKSRYEAPHTKLEGLLVKIWQELLAVERVSIHDNFFELGGHSLLATRIISAIRKQLKLDISVKTLFSYPTIASFAKKIDNESKPAVLPPVPVLSRPEQIPLSFSQERLWFLDKMEGSVQYHMPVILRLKGKLNKAALNNALSGIIERHEVLRTVFRDEQGRGFQFVNVAGNRKLHIVEGARYKEDPAALWQYIEHLIEKPFDLTIDKMLRSTLIEIDEDEYVLVVVMHHIASDGWSLSIIVREVAELYNSYQEREVARLLVLPIQYADFAIWQRQYLQGGTLDSKIDYWKDKLNAVEPVEIPSDFVRPLIQNTQGDFLHFQIDRKLTDGLYGTCNHNNVTLFMTLLSVFKVLLYRYSDQQDICVGTVTAGRQYDEVENLVGFFVNTLALRDELRADMSFKELLEQVKTTTIEAYANEEVPFEKVVDVVTKKRDLSRSPLFQVMFVLQNTPAIGELRFAEVKLTLEAVEKVSIKFDLSFNLRETANGLQGLVEFSSSLYRRDTIERMVGHYQQLLNSVIKEPGIKISLLQILSGEEESKLLEGLETDAGNYPQEKNMVDLFTEQVIKTPFNIAIVFEGKEITYEKLNIWSNQVAFGLSKRGVKSEQLVLICIERGIGMIAGILGILKAGAAYVPVDPEYPLDRISYIISDTAASTVISSAQSKGKLEACKEIDVMLIEELEGFDITGNSNPNTIIKPSHLAYVIYTSGSTGKPKGVLIEHRNVVRLFKSERQIYDFNDKDVWSLFHSFCFDFSVWEMYGALFFGGKLVIVPAEATRDVTLLTELLVKEKVTVLNQTPSVFYVLQDYFVNTVKATSIRYVVFGGEALNPAKLKLWKSHYKNCRLINMYGITETTVHVSYQEIGDVEIDNSNSIIGKPIPTLSIYILDKELNLVPVGVQGEMFIAGAGLVRGYLNREDLTEERFIKKRFRDVEVRLYRTGDLGRWLSNGMVEYLGRKDEQVKIRGFRVEPGEIENELQSSGLIKQAFVMAREDPQGNKGLVAYVVPEGKFKKEEIISFLQSRLPYYMVPAIWVEMEALPLTSNGKIDRKALPAPDVMVELLTNEYSAPRNELEAAMCKVWQELLHVDRVGIEDNFFELGGDSIMTIQLVSRMRYLNCTVLPKDVFLNQTIAALSLVIASRSKVEKEGEQGLLTGEFGLLPIQAWYLEKQDKDLSHFNQSVLLTVKKNFTEEILTEALEQLIIHHDSLRLKFIYNEGNWTQEYNSAKVELSIEDLQPADGNSALLLSETAFKYQISLNIEKGDLVRVVWFRLGSDYEDKLLIIVHHLAIDGVSWRILIEDLQHLLDNDSVGQKITLSSKGTSYRQWHAALKAFGKTEAAMSQLQYWEQSANSNFKLPVDKLWQQEVHLKDVNNYTAKFGKEQTAWLIKDISAVYQTNINDILLTALSKTLDEWSGGSMVIIGLEGHGREEIGENLNTSRTVGWFTTLYPVTIETVPGMSDSDWIKSVKEQLRQVPDKGIGYGVLKYINKEAVLQGSDNFEIIFNYLGQTDNITESGDSFAISGGATGAGRSKEHRISEKISVNSLIRAGELVLNWSYSNKHFEKETIKTLAENYLHNLSNIVDHCITERTAGKHFYTPSDYGLGSDIKYNELDDFLNEEVRGQKRKNQIGDLYRLSGLQQGMLFHGLYNKNSTAYTEQISCSLSNLNIEIFTLSWKYILGRHSTLRSAFYYDIFNVPVQVVYNEVELPVEIADYRKLDVAAQSQAIKNYAREDLSKGFDFTHPPLMRIGLLQVTDDSYSMLWTSHHLLFDGWSMPVIIEEFLTAYETLLAGKELKSTPQDNYGDYIKYIEKRDKRQEETYWRNYLKSLEPTLLPFTKTTQELTKGAGNYKTISLDVQDELSDKLHQYVKKHRITMNTLMQGIWALLLHYYTGKDDILYGVVVSGRPEELANVEKRVGLYINTLPLYVNTSNDHQITRWLQALQDQQVLSRQYQYTPLSDIQQWNNQIQGDLFDTILVFENYPLSEVVNSGKWLLQVKDVQMKEQSNYPLSIEINSAGKLNVRFNYNNGLLNDNYAQQVHDHFSDLLTQITDLSKFTLGDLSLLSSTEINRLLTISSGADTNYPRDKSIAAVFEAQVATTPANVAVVFESQHLTYEQLDAQANQLANYMRTKGIGQETLVPVCLQRSADLIIVVLAILKAGGAYVTLDPAYPAERINYVLGDINATVIITSKEYTSKFSGLQELEILETGQLWETIKEYPTTNLSAASNSRSLAYVIYTSGSTGRPKGVLVEQGNVVSLVKGAGYVSPGENDVLLATGSPSFDASTFEYWSMLLNGGRLILCNDDVLFDSKSLKQQISSYKVNIMWFTAGWFNQLADTDITVFESLETILAGGEKLSERHIKKVIQAYPDLQLINGYGPTENTTFSLTYNLKGVAINGPVPIGQPLGNRSALILGNDEQLLPAGVPGEICVGGAGLARGYLNQPALTAEKFIKNPYRDEPGQGDRLYRTGDLGRLLPDGNIEYLGRTDDQVKIRGYRIEPGEIENLVQESGLVKQVVVLASEDKEGSKRLVGYMVADDDAGKEKINKYLRDRLPDYMIPDNWIKVTAIPLTANGKTDRKALIAMHENGFERSEFVAPSNEMEERLAKIWQEILGIDQVGVSDNFFELGGHSLLAMRVIAAIRREFKAEVNVKDIFEFNNIADLGKYLEIQLNKEPGEQTAVEFDVLNI